MTNEKEILSISVDRELSQKFKKLVKSSGYTQKAVMVEVIKEAVRALEARELKEVGGLFNAEKTD